MKHIEKKRLTYFMNVPIGDGELTVVGSDHAESTMMHSCRLAGAINKTGLGVMIINCGMSDRRFRDHFHSVNVPTAKPPRLVMMTSVRGNLVAERELIEEYVDAGRLGIVILTGWEWAADSYKRRRRLLTFLRELMQDYGIAIVVYANTRRELVAGKSDPCGLGNLTLLAYAATNLGAAEELDGLVVRPTPVVFDTPEYKEAARGVERLVRNINGIQPLDPWRQDVAESAEAGESS